MTKYKEKKYASLKTMKKDHFPLKASWVLILQLRVIICIIVY